MDRAGGRWHRPHLPFRQAAGDARISGYYNVVAPEYSADWQLRALLQLMFRKWAKTLSQGD